MNLYPGNPKPSIYDLDFEEMGKLLTETKQPSYRRLQIWEGLYKQLWTTVNHFSTLPKEFRNQLEDQYLFSSLKITKMVHSKDGDTLKWLFSTIDGAPVETVLMHYRQRNSLCISSQSGCSMGCIFCATGQMGYKRNLSAGEIIEQVIQASVLLKKQGEHLTNVIVMGMGEPFLNYQKTLKAIEILNDENGFNFGVRRFTISTVGIVPGIYQFSKEKNQINLAISLHAANNKLRNSLLPINRKYPIEMLMNACHDYVNTTHRRLSFEWVMIDGLNDSADDAHELVNLLSGLLCHINLIPMNPTKYFTGQASSRSKIETFHQILINSGLPCSIRLRRGVDIHAGCGQLAATSS